MALTFRSLERWPYPETRQRQSSPFRASHADTLTLLNRELLAVGAQDAEIGVVAAAGQVRRDGMLRSGARVDHPGVVVTFGGRAGRLAFACDRYQPVSWRYQAGWQVNLRAIALGLEALRQVDRYGLSRGGEQYAGYRALEAGSDTDDQMRALLAAESGVVYEGSTENRLRVYRTALKRAHPDHGGTGERLQAVMAAGRYLGLVD